MDRYCCILCVQCSLAGTYGCWWCTASMYVCMYVKRSVLREFGFGREGRLVIPRACACVAAVTRALWARGRWLDSDSDVVRTCAAVDTDERQVERLCTLCRLSLAWANRSCLRPLRSSTAYGQSAVGTRPSAALQEKRCAIFLQ